jgi:hypothetical protein
MSAFHHDRSPAASALGHDVNGDFRPTADVDRVPHHHRMCRFLAAVTLIATAIGGSASAHARLSVFEGQLDFGAETTFTSDMTMRAAEREYRRGHRPVEMESYLFFAHGAAAKTLGQAPKARSFRVRFKGQLRTLRSPGGFKGVADAWSIESLVPCPVAPAQLNHCSN